VVKFCISHESNVLKSKGEIVMGKHYIRTTAALLITIGITANAAKLSTSDKAVIKQHIKLSKEQAMMNQAASSSIRNQMSMLDKYSSALEALKNGDSSKINYQEKNLERNKKNSANSLKYAKKSYNKLKKQVNSIKKDKVKEQELNKLTAQKQKIVDKINKLKEPFQDRKNKVISRIDSNQKNRELKALLESLMTPTSQRKSNLVNRKSLSATFTSGFVSCQWFKGNNQIAWAHIRIRPIPKHISSKEKLAGKYPVSSSSSTSAWFWVKNLNICFAVNDNAYKTKEKVKKLASEMLNLKGLEKACSKKIIRQSVTTYEFVDQLRRNENAATGKQNRERYKIDRKISALAKEGYRTSSDTEKLMTSFANAKSNYENYKNNIAASNQLIELLKSPAAQRGKAISELEKKVTNIKNNILTACRKLSKQKAALTKNMNFTATNKRYQTIAEKFFRIPKGREYALINRTAIDPWLGVPQINCRWLLDMSTPRSQSTQQAFSGKISYNPDYQSSFNKGMINNKYRIYQLSNYSISVKVGDFIISLNPTNRRLYDQSALIKAVKELFDLEAIADATK
jgi:DNA repair exonuclease SbcCD ATPase subunit